MPEVTPWNTGVYKIVNKVTGKFYIGGAYKSFAMRKADHWKRLRSGTHRNSHLQHSWDKYGEDSFDFEIIERAPPVKKTILACEQKWLDTLRPFDKSIGYNICSIADSRLGVKHSKEARAKISVANRNRSPESIAKIAKTKLGSTHTLETRAKMSATRKGKKLPWQHKIAAANRGRKNSLEAKARMVEGWKLRKMKYGPSGKKKNHEPPTAVVGENT